MDIPYAEIMYSEYFPDTLYPFGFHPDYLNKESMSEF